MNRIAAIMGMQRSGTHFLGAMLSSHPAIKYTGEIFRGRAPRSPEQLVKWVDRVRGGGFNVILLDTKYNQISKYVEQMLCSENVKVIEIVRRNKLRLYFSGELHHWRGLHPDADVMPTFRFKRAQFNEIHAEIYRHQGRVGYLADMVLYYEDLTSDRNTLALTEAVSWRLCDLLGVERRVLTLPANHDKEAPTDYLSHLTGVPDQLVRRFEGE